MFDNVCTVQYKVPRLFHCCYKGKHHHHSLMRLLYCIPGLMRFFRRAEAATRGRGLLVAEGSIELRRAVSFVRAMVNNNNYYCVSIVLLLRGIETSLLMDSKHILSSSIKIILLVHF